MVEIWVRGGYLYDRRGDKLMKVSGRHRFIKVIVAAFFVSFVGLSLLAPAPLSAGEKSRPALFLPEERQIIREFFYGQPSGLPPGLAKRSELPPGLQKHLQRNGKLPPGLQKRLEPFPNELEVRLPGIPDIWRRVILGRHVILIDRRTYRILDIIENVVGLMTNS